MAINLMAGTSTAPVTGDPELIRRVVGNLAENAVRHNISGGWIKFETGHRDGESVSRASNSSAVLRSQEVRLIFEPFVRLGKARTGSAKGTGLNRQVNRPSRRTSPGPDTPTSTSAPASAPATSPANPRGFVVSASERSSLVRLVPPALMPPVRSNTTTSPTPAASSIRVHA